MDKRDMGAVIGQSQATFLYQTSVYKATRGVQVHCRCTGPFDSPFPIVLSHRSLSFAAFSRSIIMTPGYRPELLAPFLRLDQGKSIQAECNYFFPPPPSVSYPSL